MRSMRLPLAAALALAACGKADKQAGALDHAAGQADPAAAASMHNAADAIRDGDSDANVSDPNSPAQAAMANAGAAAAGTPTGTPADKSPGVSQLVNRAEPVVHSKSGVDTRGAKPHKAGEPVPGGTEPTGK